MRRSLRLTTLLTMLFVWPVTASTPETDTLTIEAARLADDFIARLKPQLKQALQQGGPGHAIEVCASQAPKIADALSAESGWQVTRVSLRPRNASRAQPDTWESSVLESFDRQLAEGATVATLRHGAVVGSNFRYLQAQSVEGVCLLCHGENISPEVAATLQEYYPDDSATGYEAGQVRGAISLIKSL